MSETTGVHLVAVTDRMPSWALLEALRAAVEVRGGVVLTARVEPLTEDETALYEQRR